MSAATIKSQLKAMADPDQAVHLQRFFKTGPGEYGYGDRFLGIKIPPLRKLAGQYRDLRLNEVGRLLETKIHEQRMIALLILTYRFERADRDDRRAIYRFYMDHTPWINNWDLVDLSAPNIVGAFLLDRSRADLYRLAKSQSLWERRIAMVSTLTFIRHHQFEDTLKIASILRNDDHDLIHKAVGWMLREAGKRDQAVLEQFLKPNYAHMPRTMLRYAIERFAEPLRQDYLKGRI